MEETKLVSETQFVEEVMRYIESTRSGMHIQPDAKPGQRALPKSDGEFIYSISVREPKGFFLSDLYKKSDTGIPPGVSCGNLIYYEIYSLPQEVIRESLDILSRSAEKITVKISGRRRRGHVFYEIQK